jgi:hypothetical protein
MVHLVPKIDLLPPALFSRVMVFEYGAIGPVATNAVKTPLAPPLDVLERIVLDDAGHSSTSS